MGEFPLLAVTLGGDGEKSILPRATLLRHLNLVDRCESQALGACRESFCERVLSAANDVLTEGNTLLDDEELEMLVILRINREFMKFMRANYSHLSRQQFNRTVVPP